MFLYVISKYRDFNIIKLKTVQIEKEMDDTYYTIDNIDVLDYKYSIKKQEIDKENKYCFITKDKRKVKKQVKRIYNNINEDLDNQITKLQYQLEQLQEIKNRNNDNYEQIMKN